MSVPASLVKELRERSGAGMMDCKRALEETGGDLEAAHRLLREKGVAAAARRAGRATTEGKVVARISDDGSVGTIVAVGCETEPVSNNSEFLELAELVLDAVERDGQDAVGSLEDARVALVARIGENISVVGASRMRAKSGEALAQYIHPPARKIGVMVRLGGSSPELARLVAMHISFASPRFVTRAEVPEAEVVEERSVLEKLPEVASKPESIRPKILEGMLAKRFFAASVLDDQPWIHDDSLTVGKALATQGAEVLEFVRLTVT